MQFQFIKDPETGQDSTNTLKFTDDNDVVMFVPIPAPIAEGTTPELIPSKNRHYIMYEQWLADGNTTLPAS